MTTCGGGADGGTTPPTTYTVTFNVNGGSGTAPAAQTVSPGSAIATLPSGTGLSKPNGYFGGWNTMPDGTGDNYSAGSSFKPTANITLYARWISGYMVTFNVNGGNGTAPAARTVNIGSAVTLPSGSGFSQSGSFFGGWNTKADGTGTNYNSGASYTPTAHITLYAKWDMLPLASVTGLANKLAWLQTHAQSNTSYTIEVNADESIGPWTLAYSGKTGITITLRGVGANRTVSLSSNGSLFSVGSVGSGVTLILDNNITLQGRSSNNASLVNVSSGGTLRINAGSKITGNTVSSSSPSGGGVYVESNGTFIISGGEITGNTASPSYYGYSAYGGGVYVESHGTFTMSGGEITGNTAFSSGSSSGPSCGGGVYVLGGGSFSKTVGTITGYESDTVNGNVVKYSSGTVRSNSGHAVYADGSSTTKRKETTAGPGVNLYFNGTTKPPTYSGEWDN